MTDKHQNKIREWKNLIDKRIKSNMKVTEWCKQNNVSQHAYYYWQNEVRKLEALILPTNNKSELNVQLSQNEEDRENSFVEITPAILLKDQVQSSISKPSAKIRYNNLEIELFEESSSIFMKRLIEVIQNA